MENESWYWEYRYSEDDTWKLETTRLTEEKAKNRFKDCYEYRKINL